MSMSPPPLMDDTGERKQVTPEIRMQEQKGRLRYLNRNWILEDEEDDRPIQRNLMSKDNVVASQEDLFAGQEENTQARNKKYSPRYYPVGRDPRLEALHKQVLEQIELHKQIYDRTKMNARHSSPRVDVVMRQPQMFNSPIVGTTTEQFTLNEWRRQSAPVQNVTQVINKVEEMPQCAQEDDSHVEYRNQVRNKGVIKPNPNIMDNNDEQNLRIKMDANMNLLERFYEDYRALKRGQMICKLCRRKYNIETGNIVRRSYDHDPRTEYRPQVMRHSNPERPDQLAALNNILQSAPEIKYNKPQQDDDSDATMPCMSLAPVVRRKVSRIRKQPEQSDRVLRSSRDKRIKATQGQQVTRPVQIRRRSRDIVDMPNPMEEYAFDGDFSDDSNQQYARAAAQLEK